MEQVKVQRIEKKRESSINLNPGTIMAIVIYVCFLGMSFYSNQIFMDKLLVIGAILSCILFIKVVNRTN